jgi:hypothetical protein
MAPSGLLSPGTYYGAAPMKKPWHYDMMNDTMYVQPWFLALAAFSYGVFIGLCFA